MTDLKSRFATARLSAARLANRELVTLNWDIGQGIVEKQKSLDRGQSVVEWVGAEELWSYVGKNKRRAGSGGLLIVLPRKSADGRWVILELKRPVH